MFQPSLLNLFAQDIPITWYEVAILPVFFAGVAAILWVAGKVKEVKAGGKAHWKWAAIPLLLLAIFKGIQAVGNIRDPFYFDAVEGHGKKMIISHYSSLVVPLVVLIGLVVWEFLERRAAADRY